MDKIDEHNKIIVSPEVWVGRMVVMQFTNWVRMHVPLGTAQSTGEDFTWKI